jgi:predicted DCC family thiol-disulfide oxidoreductase YuxK
MPPFSANPVLLYDGVCGLCNRLVRFVLKRDPGGRFRFASLQSGFAANILIRHGAQVSGLDTVYVLLCDQRLGEKLLARSDAAVAVLLQLGGVWRVLGTVLRIFPKGLRDGGYGWIARNRYRIFGKHDSCPLVEQKYRSRFLDQ